MRSAVTTRPGAVAIQQRATPGCPDHGETLLRIEMVGICGSNLHLFHADLDPSHEGLLPGS